MTETDDYLLGMAPDEIDRLGRQHTAWRDHTIKVWDSMDIDDGNTVVDLGCGPGFATEDLPSVWAPRESHRRGFFSGRDCDVEREIRR